MKHLPFDSKFRRDFQVVEQREGKTRLYPHTAQLPVLLKALHTEFYRLLPPRISDPNAELKDYHKIALFHSCVFFCNVANAERKDEVLLFPLYDKNLVPRPAIVQQITEDHPMGRTHRFRFYGGENFFPEIYADGRRIVFAEHTLKRYSDRGESSLTEDTSDFILSFFLANLIGMQVGPGRAFVAGYGDSILAFPYKQYAKEYFIQSCLTINEIHSLKYEKPPHTITLHYDQPFLRPRYRNWSTMALAQHYVNAWERKIKPEQWSPEDPKTHKPYTWEECAAYGRRMSREEGYGPESRIIFSNVMPGPVAMQFRPEERGVMIDDLNVFKEQFPRGNWEQAAIDREKNGTFSPMFFDGRP